MRRERHDFRPVRRRDIPKEEFAGRAWHNGRPLSKCLTTLNLVEGHGCPSVRKTSSQIYQSDVQLERISG
jgi:hypothetical protein